MGDGVGALVQVAPSSQQTPLQIQEPSQNTLKESFITTVPEQRERQSQLSPVVNPLNNASHVTR